MKHNKAMTGFVVMIFLLLLVILLPEIARARQAAINQQAWTQGSGFDLTDSGTPVAVTGEPDTNARGGEPDELAPVPDAPEMANLYEGFENIYNLPSADWHFQNLSQPLGTISWFQGNEAVFTARAGSPNSYAGVNYNSTTGVGTISNWLLTPVLNLNNGDRLRFWTRTSTGTQWPDRLQVRMSLSGSSTNVGSTATSVGSFTTLLLDINPTYAVNGYPQVWTQYTVLITGVPTPTDGRLAFRYFVENGGPDGTNSNYIGIDSFAFYEDTQFVYLPLVVGNYCGGFVGPLEVEPNDAAAQANGRLCVERNYRGSPDNHGSSLDSDYFYIDVTGSGTLVVDVTNFLTEDAQVQLYRSPVSSGTLLVNVANQASGNYHIAYPVSPGRYYIRAVAADGHPTGNGNYTLRVSGP